MDTSKTILALLITLLIITDSVGQAKEPSAVRVFAAGEDGYYHYRIPSLLTTSKGTVLAFAEARKRPGDAGDIDLVVKRSSDNGKTWSDQEIVWDDGSNTCGNPTPVLDEETGTIWLLVTHNRGADKEGDIIKKTSTGTRTVWVSSSEDDGLTWSKPVDITQTTKDSSWGWYATGPGIGIQIKHGPHRGRLVIPSDHSYDDPDGNVRGGPFEYGSHIIYSDDHGKSWHLGGTIRPKVNECQVVELADGNGTLLMNMRSYFGTNRRTHSISYDGGITWTSPKDVDELVEPVCQASILRYRWPDQHGVSIIVFLNPASASNKFRHNMMLRASYDEGKTWPYLKSVYPGPSAYSCMAVLKDGSIGLLYEAGDSGPYERIEFLSIVHSVMGIGN